MKQHVIFLDHYGDSRYHVVTRETFERRAETERGITIAGEFETRAEAEVAAREVNAKLARARRAAR
jgi:hypothetical protein